MRVAGIVGCHASRKEVGARQLTLTLTRTLTLTLTLVGCHASRKEVGARQRHGCARGRVLRVLQRPVVHAERRQGVGLPYRLLVRHLVLPQ